MYIDKLNLFHEDAPVTSSAVKGTAIDLMAAGNDPGTGELVRVVIQITAAFGGTGTLTATIVDDDNSALATPATLATSTDVAITGFLDTVGYKLPLPALPREKITQRYLGVVLTPSATLSGGTVSAWIAWDEQSMGRGYPAEDGF